MPDPRSEPAAATPSVLTPGPTPRSALILVTVTYLFLLIATAAVVAAGDLAPLWFEAFYVIAALVYPVMGLLIVRRIPSNQVGWLLIAIGLCAATALAAVATMSMASTYVEWAAEWLPAVPILMLPLPLLTFPDGPLDTTWWRVTWWVAWSAVVLPTALIAIGTWLEPLPMTEWWDPDAQFNTSADPYVIGGILLLAVLLTSASVGGVVALRARRRTADAYGRGQLRLLGLGLAVVPPAVLLEIWIPDVLVIAAVSVPLAMTLAIVAHGLYDIDLFINRSIVYSVLTLVVFCAYTATVEIVNTAFRASPLASFAGTGVVAAMFKPVRDHVQEAVNRLLHGDRDDPYAVLSRLGMQLEAMLDPDSVVPGMAETIMSSLRVPYVEVRVRRDGQLRSEVRIGRLVGEPAVYVMRHRGEVVGELVVSPRHVGHPFTTSEDSMLQDIARRAAGAVAAVVEVQSARHPSQRPA